MSVYRWSIVLLVLVIGVLKPPNVSALVFDRANVTVTGIQGTGPCHHNSISGNGRYVAYAAQDDGLVPGISGNVESHVFIKDRSTGEIRIVGLNSLGVISNGYCDYPSISYDGRYLAFVSTATNLLPVSPSSTENVFLYDRETKEMELVNVSNTGEPGNEGGGLPNISGDGRFVVFGSVSTNLVSVPLVTAGQVYVRDRMTGITELVSVNNAGQPSTAGSGGGGGTAISGDGRWIVYIGDYTNLVTGMNNGETQVYLYDRLLQNVKCISVNASGIPGNGYSFGPNINADGSVITFTSESDNLVAGDVNGTSYDVFLYNAVTETLEIASKDEMGMQHLYHLGRSHYQSVSSDGKKVIYYMTWPSWYQVYFWDRDTNTRMIISEDSAGNPGDNYSDLSTISADGNCIAFSSFATNLLIPDANGSTRDIYVTCLSPPVWPTDTPTATLTPTASPTYSPTVSSTPTSTPASTATIATPTPDCRDGRSVEAVIYPNPAKDRVVVQVRSSLCRNVEWMKIKIYTTSYRKLAEISLGPQMAGVLDTTVELRDEQGSPLANGLYYLTVETPFDQTVGKLMVLQ